MDLHPNCETSMEGRKSFIVFQIGLLSHYYYHEVHWKFHSNTSSLAHCLPLLMNFAKRISGVPFTDMDYLKYQHGPIITSVMKCRMKLLIYPKTSMVVMLMFRNVITYPRWYLIQPISVKGLIFNNSFLELQFSHIVHVPIKHVCRTH